MRPSTSTGEDTVAEKFCPVAEVLEPMASSKTTEIVVSAGTTSGREVDSREPGLPDARDAPMELSGESAEELFEAESEAD